MLTAALQYELQIAKQQSQDLQRTSEFFDALLLPKPTTEEPQSHARNKSRTEDIHISSSSSVSALPPLPQLIGWEPPRVLPFPNDRIISPKLRSEKTTKPDPTSPSTQHPSLVDALAKARKELEDKTALVKDLEDALKREKSARELAEDRAAELETASRVLGGTSRERILGEFEAEKVLADERGEMDDTETICGDDEKSLDGQPMEDEISSEDGDPMQVKVDPSALAAAEAASRLQRRVEEMMLELQSAKAEIEIYKFRTKESDTTRKTLQEMVEDFQRKEEVRKAKERQFGSQTEPTAVQNTGMQANTDIAHDEIMETVINGTVKQSDIMKKLPSRTTIVSDDLARTSLALSKKNAAPYVSIIGVMLLGVGMMAVLNSWQKGER